METAYSLDLRYHGQSYTLTLPWRGIEETVQAFHREHEQRYGHRLSTPVELVNIRCNLHGRPPEIELPEVAVGAQPAASFARLAGFENEVPVWRRESLHQGQEITGPALITETVATTWLPAGWNCRVDRVGNLQLERT